MQIIKPFICEIFHWLKFKQPTREDLRYGRIQEVEVLESNAVLSMDERSENPMLRLLPDHAGACAF